MYWFFIIYVICVLTFGALTLFSFSNIRFKEWIMPVLLFGMFLYFAISSFAVMGYPRPFNLSPHITFTGEKIISFHLVENQAIYIWILVDNEPVAISLPWSKEKAKKLMEQSRVAKRLGKPLEIGKMSEKDGGDMTFIPLGVNNPPKPEE